ncbi:hypothetical protein AZL_027410 [Azospirillum sp. B510]|uniref:type I-G CRISPR-associated protein, Cas3-extension family n=1 Tax=Azospirillum sp. (strain B510) TaxID=137722 RepID=UPI0001C4C726|nr:hypothetical protein [Azospirillum sp. B510]BAI73379.1 hypothetical protein AZL_027410 [Azospirillum sp. B510]
MTTARQDPATEHRLDGLEPDNLLAFLALLGLLRALEATDRAREAADRLHPRACWSLDKPPLRPVLRLACPLTRDEVAGEAAQGINLLTKVHDFGKQKDLNYTRQEARELLEQAADTGADRAILLAALMTDAAIKDEDKPDTAPIDPTPLCLLFGQGHQHFLERLARVPAEPAPPPRGRGKKAVTLTAADCLAEALFAPWHRDDPTSSFRWDPEEDVRYALMAGNPTDPAYKLGTQHGANRLAAVGLAALTLAPETRAGRVRPTQPGGAWSKDGFSFAWPVWRDPASLSAIRALLGHPDLREPGGLSHLGVEHVFAAQRISVGKFMNFTRARLIETPGDPS